MVEPTTRELLRDLRNLQVQESEAAKHIYCVKDYCGVSWSGCRRDLLPGIIVHIQFVKKILATRPHVPNKEERKAARRASAKNRHGKGKSRNR